MHSEGSLTLRERAALAWKEERPIREAARLEKRAKQVAAVRERLTRIFGAKYEIRVGIDANERVIARVEDLRFTVLTSSVEFFSISLVESCPHCGEDMPIGTVSNLADIGQLLEKFETGCTHECK